MRDQIRRVCAVQAVTGFGTGSHLVVLALPNVEAGEAAIARASRLGAGLAESDGFVQSYLLVPDTALSTPLPRESTENRQLVPMFVVEGQHRAGRAGAARPGRLRVRGRPVRRLAARPGLETAAADLR